MKQLTRQEVEAVVERLKEKNECLAHRYCVVCKRRRNTQITIGHVLFWMQNVSCEHMDDDTFGIYCKKLCLLWEPLGFKKSLQEVIEESGWRTVFIDDATPTQHEIEILGSPEANALFSFLQQLL